MKTPPSFSEGEVAILGSCLLDSRCIPSVLELITAEDFYHERNRIVFSAIIAIYDRGETPDWVSLTAHLQNQGKLETIGGPAFLTELVDAVPSVSNVNHYAELVHEKSKLRQVISAAAEITSKCYDTEASIDAVMEDFQKSAFEIAIDAQKSLGLIHVSQVVQSGVTAIERAQSGIKGLSSGLSAVDQILDGFYDEELYIIGGRPSMGKTALLMEILDHVSRQHPCGFFSLEMSNEQNGLRLLARKTGINLRNLRRGLVGNSEWPKVVDATGSLADRKLYVDQTPYLTLSKIRNRVRQLATKSKTELRLIAIDYLQLMIGEKKAQNRDREISDLTRGLKLLAKEFSVPVVALSQLSRKLEERPVKNCGRRPIMSDLRDSGSIEQDADGIMFIFRQEVYEPENTLVKGLAEVIIAKQRNGSTGTAVVQWDPAIVTFRDREIRLDERNYMEAM